MKRLALLAAVVLFAACAPKAEETSETAAPAATVPAATDSATMTDSTKTDSTKTDSTATKAM